MVGERLGSVPGMGVGWGIHATKKVLPSVEVKEAVEDALDEFLLGTLGIGRRSAGTAKDFCNRSLRKVLEALLSLQPAARAEFIEVRRWGRRRTRCS